MSWKNVKIGKVLKQYRIEHWVQNDKLYKQVSILNDGSVVLRGEKIGKDIGRKRQFIINLDKYPDTLIFTRQLLLQGSIGMASEEVNGCIVTENMPMFSVEGINPEFLFFFIKSELFKAQVRNLKTSGTAQKSLHERQFLELEIPLPSDREQKQIIKRCKLSETNFGNIISEIENQQTHLQQLRQAILQEAVQGKLSESGLTEFKNEQNKKPHLKNSENSIHPANSDSDNDAAKLLQRIKAEKQKLIAAGKLKKEKELPPITEDEIPFELPKGWVWCRLGEIINLVSGVTLGKTYKEEVIKVPYLRVANVQRGYVDITHLKELAVPRQEIEKYALKEGDLVMIEGGDWDKVGRCAIWNGEVKTCIHQNHIFRLRFYGKVSNQWAELFLNSPVARRYFESCSKQTTNLASINKTQLTNLLFALPPLSEQQRIVAKVQQLLQMVNQLEQQVGHSQTQAQQLLQAVLKEAFISKGKVYKENELLTLAAEE